MGPLATVDFIAKVISATEAGCEQDHLRMLVDHNPGVPNRHAAIPGQTESIGRELADMATGLERAGADFVVMACNTAHFYATEIARALSIPFINLIDEVVMEIQQVFPAVRCVAVMAADGCLDARLYQDALKRNDYQVLTWDQSERERFMALLYRVKAGERGTLVEHEFAELANSLVDKGAEILIDGCTEIPLMQGTAEPAVPVISSTDVLVARTITHALG